MDDVALQQRLDRALAAAPPALGLAPILREGRRIVRRRRALATGVGAATVVVLSLAGWELSGGGSDHAPVAGPAAGEVSPSPTELPSSDTEPMPASSAEGEAFYFNEAGVLVVPRGVTIHRRVEDPLGLDHPATSVALDYTSSDGRSWMLAVNAVAPGGQSGSLWQSGPSAIQPDFDEWLADEVEAYGAGPGEWMAEPVGSPKRLAFRDGRLIGIGDVTVVDQTVPVLPADMSPTPDTLLVAALIEQDGARSFVLARLVGSTLQTIPGGPAAGRSLEQFVDEARVAYESGEGLR